MPIYWILFGFSLLILFPTIFYGTVILPRKADEKWCQDFVRNERLDEVGAYEEYKTWVDKRYKIVLVSLAIVLLTSLLGLAIL